MKEFARLITEVWLLIDLIDTNELRGIKINQVIVLMKFKTWSWFESPTRQFLPKAENLGFLSALLSNS